MRERERGKEREKHWRERIGERGKEKTELSSEFFVYGLHILYVWRFFLSFLLRRKRVKVNAGEGPARGGGRFVLKEERGRRRRRRKRKKETLFFSCSLPLFFSKGRVRPLALLLLHSLPLPTHWSTHLATQAAPVGAKQTERENERRRVFFSPIKKQKEKMRASSSSLLAAAAAAAAAARSAARREAGLLASCSGSVMTESTSSR